MSKLGFAGAIVAIVGVATWTYNVNYQTKTTMGRISDIRHEITTERERIQVLEVEWAWLNNPQRLERLTVEHAPALGLQPLHPGVFGRAGDVPEPPEDEAEIDPLLLATLLDAHAAGLVGSPAGIRLPPPRPASWGGE